MIGRTISHYRIIEKVGGGGMGVVYRAEDLKLGRFVALKFLSEHTAADPINLDRFRREARAVSTLNHPNICTIYEIDEAEGHIFIAMELLDGGSLDRRIDAKALTIETLLSLGLQLAAGLEAAHSKGIIHRDIKPGNLFLNSQGQLKILDFGLAKLDSAAADEAGGSEIAVTQAENLTKSGTTLGTIAYMSPEQARGDEIDTRSDLFSAGSVLYELATGAAAFSGRTGAIVLDGVLNREPVSSRELNPSIPAELGRIIEKCLEKEREVRYQHASDLSADLKRLKRDMSSGTSSVMRPEAGSSSAIFAAAKRHRLGTATGLIVALGLVVAAVYGTFEFARRQKHGVFENYTLNQVTDFGDLENTVISPDGKYLGFVRAGKGTVKARSLWLRQLSTNSDTQVLSSIEPVLSLSFSPDQTYLFYRLTEPEQIWRHDLYRVPIFGGKPQIVAQDIDGDPSLVNDGRQLCFQRGGVIEPPSYSVILLDLKTGAEQTLLHGSGRAETVACSPDGKTAAFFFPRLSGSPENHLSAASLPDGKQRVFAKLGLGGVAVKSMVWLPNQEEIILTKETEPGFRAQLVQVAYSDGNERQITNDLNEYDSIGISSDGKILSSLKTESTRSFYIWSAGQAGPAKFVEFLKDPMYFRWSDPEKVVFNTPGMDLRVANLTAGESANVSADRTHKLWGPGLCGQGDIVAVGIGSDEGSQGIWKLNLTTGIYKQITNGADDRYPQCTTDGKWIVYGDAESNGLMRVPAEGGTPVKIPGQADLSFDFSLDGTRLMYLDFRNNEPNGPLKPVIHLVATNDWKEIATIPLGTMSTPMVRFMPDGKSAAFATTVDGIENLWVKPLEGGATRQLTHFDNGDSIEDFHWSPDGKKLGIIRERVSADAVLFRDVEK